MIRPVFGPKSPVARELRRLCLGIVCIAWVVLLALPRTAWAHAVGLSNGEYRSKGDSVLVSFAFARAEASKLCPGLDEDHDGALTETELARGLPELDQRLVRSVLVQAGSEACPGRLVSAKLTEEDGISVDAAYTCASPAPRRVVFAVLTSLPKGHRHLARQLRDGAPPHDDLLSEGHDTFPLVSEGAGSSTKESKESGSFFGFFRLGLEHILTGYDHLVFLFGLVLVRGKLRSYLAVVTAFTVAHSITLGLAVLGLVNPSARFIEPAIALSIAYVGIENFLVQDAARRWRITFPFGLLHGFGFAGALREIDLPKSRIPSALVAFNLGVEAGQLAALVVAIPLVLWVTKRHTNVRITRGLSACVALAGLVWFVARVL